METMGSQFLEKWRNRLEPRLVSDRHYIEKVFFRKTGKILDLKTPKTFNEKIQWLKLFYRDPILPVLVDKIAVKDYISNLLGSEYLIPTAAVFSSSKDIDRGLLPEQCILKATHGSGWNKIVENKELADLEELRSYFKFFMKKNYFVYSKEWAYKQVKPQILCEPLLFESSGQLPKDYKIFCFNGVPEFVAVDVDRFSNHTRVFYDRDWIRQDFTIGYPLYSGDIERPGKLDLVLALAAKLSTHLPFMRVDFLLVDSVPFINELTLYPGNGLDLFSSEDYNQKLGSMLSLKGL